MAHGVRRCYVAAMGTFLSNIALPVALAAVTIVLQRLMQLRVLLQFVAIVITMLALFALGR